MIRVMTWDINHYMEPSSVSTKERKSLIDYALKGNAHQGKVICYHLLFIKYRI
jgi:hypothetical protein